MASEAQRLIGISLTKIAQSRTHRGGVSLHKNLLVATVLQKARYIFMEEAYNMVHYQAHSPIHQQQQHQQQVAMMHHQQQQSEEQQQEDDVAVGLTVEEAGIEAMSLPEDQETSNLQEYLQPDCAKCSSTTPSSTPPQPDKENQPPGYFNGSPSSTTELTYLDLDNKQSPNVLKDRSNNGTCLKRRRAVSEWETEEAVQSILPKRRCTDLASPEDDNVFLEDAASLLSESVSRELEANNNAAASSNNSTTTNSSSNMEIDRITSLVSIFSFGMNAPDSGKQTQTSTTSSLSSSSQSSTTTQQTTSRVGTPDLCSSQAKEGDNAIQQRPFLAMTV